MQKEAGRPTAGAPQLRDLFARAVACQGQGLYADAERLCEQIVGMDPQHADAMNLAGIVASQTGRPEVALEWLGRAIALSPRKADYRANLALVLRQAGRKEEAMAANRAAIELNPKHVNALANLSQLQLDSGDAEGAAKSARRALGLQRDHVDALLNLGMALYQLADPLDESDPKRLAALIEAVKVLGRAVELRPASADGHSSLGAALFALDRLDEAGESCLRALRIDPRRADTHNNLGTVLWAKGHRPEALAAHRQAIALDPRSRDAYYNLGSALFKSGELEEAVDALERAVALDPKAELAHQALGFTLLAQGKLEAGFKEREWRWQGKESPLRRPHSQPWWQGEDISRQSILVWGEQGMGDEVEYTSIIPDLAARAGHVVLECDPRLVPLFERSFAGVEVVPRQAPVAPRLLQDDLRLQAPLGHTFRWLRPTMESFRTSGGHLRADADKVAHWKSRLAALGDGPKVGVAWRSKLMTKSRAHHFATIEQWGEVLHVPGVCFVNLQYDECSAELRSAEERFGVTVHAFADIDLMNDLDGAAALTSAVDLVISPGTSVAVMSGALGIPTWMLAPEHAIWETLGTDGVPFLPSVRMVHRPFGTSWDTTLAAVAEKLRAHLAARG